MSDSRRSYFGSDNYAGACPEVWRAMQASGGGRSPAYGEDDHTKRACDRLREIFDTDCEVFFVFNGTAANSLALASLCQSYHSVICAPSAHVETDECGAPEFFSNGTKILLTEDTDGKVSPSEVDRLRCKRSDIHYPKPRVLSLTQATELGTVYDPDELRALCAAAHAPIPDQDGRPIVGSELKVHMDGARFANAVASLDAEPADLTWKAGVDVLCFGGTKMGMPVGEAVIFFDKNAAVDFAYRCKQAGQLASKMRFLAIPWLAMLEDGLWLSYARHANDCAEKLSELLSAVPGVELCHPRQANSVFLKLPSGVAEELSRRWNFYTFIGGGARFMCAWDTDMDVVGKLVKDIEELVAQRRQ